MIAAGLSGCGKSAPQGANAGSAAPGSPRHAEACVRGATHAANFWNSSSRCRLQTTAAAKALGDVEVDFRIPSSAGTAEQQQILNDLVSRGENGIAVSPIDPANQTDFLNKIAGQTLLICSDSDAAASKRVKCYIGTE